MKTRFLILAALAAFSLGVQAKVRLSHLVGDNMIIQQLSDVRLWGWDKPGTKVKVTTSWSSDVVTATADSQGRWLAKVRSPKAS